MDSDFAPYDKDFPESPIQQPISFSAACSNTTSRQFADHPLPSFFEQPFSTATSTRRIHSALNIRHQPTHATAPVAKLPHHPHPSLWHHHVLALPHNAIRAELFDLCALLNVLTTSSAPLLADWHRSFDEFLHCYFLFEKEALIPWVYASHADALPDRSSLEKRSAAITEARGELLRCINIMRSMQFTQVLPLLLRASRNLTDVLLNYMDAQDKAFPSVIREFRSREDALNVERLMARRLDIGIMLRWIPSRSQRAQLRTKLLAAKGWISWFRKGNKVLMDHLSIVDAILDQR